MPETISMPDREPADAKAWFYLDNRGDIEMWATLRDDASAFLHRNLIALAPWFEELAAEVGAEPDSGNIEAGSWPRLGLSRPTWADGGIQDVSVVLQWERSRLLKPGPNEWPFVAVRLSRTQDDQTRKRSLLEALAPARSRFKAKAGDRWPLWTYVRPPDSETALAPRELATEGLQAFRQLWDEVAPVLDALHADQGATPAEAAGG